jgi:hypothetical protein
MELRSASARLWMLYGSRRRSRPSGGYPEKCGCLLALVSPIAAHSSARKVGNEMSDQNLLPETTALDGDERITDFFARHGGAGHIDAKEGDKEFHTRGWSEVFAADGYKLRCEWSKAGTKTTMSFSEIPP